MQDFCASIALFIFGFLVGVLFCLFGIYHDAKRTGCTRDFWAAFGITRRGKGGKRK